MCMVVGLTITSIVLHSIHLADTNAISSIVSIVFLSLMFVTPMLKRFLGDIGQWIFIVVAVGSLLSQSYAYCENIPNEKLGVSVLCTLVASYLGHMFKERKKIKTSITSKYDEKKVRYYMLTHIVKFMLASASLVIAIVNLSQEKIPSDIIAVLTISALFVYVFLAGLVAFISPMDQVQLYIELLCGLGPKIQMFDLSGNTVDTKIISGAASLAGLSIMVGSIDSNISYVISLIAICLALVADHVAVLYFRDHYMMKIEQYKLA